MVYLKVVKERWKGRALIVLTSVLSLFGLTCVGVMWLDSSLPILIST